MGAKTSDCPFCDDAVTRIKALEDVVNRMRRELAILRGDEYGTKLSVLTCLECRKHLEGSGCSVSCTLNGKPPYERDPALMEYRDYAFLTRRDFSGEIRAVLKRISVLVDEDEFV